jgi:ABC-type Fe3+/spermidine/putrescine transport system ATPase subunit
MVFQNYSLFPHMSVGENVAFGLKMRGLNAADRVGQSRAMLEMVRLAQYEDHAVHQLSGGQQQRVALARALATSPAILLLDEPLGALDKNLRERMQFELREIQRKLNITSILVTHDQEEALTMSDRIAVMMRGAVVQVGRPTDVYDRPRTRFVSEFLGTANVFVGTVAQAGTSGTWIVALDVQPHAQAAIMSPEPLTVGQRVTLAVRPERLVIVPATDRVLCAVVKDVVFRGSSFAYELVLAGQDQPIFLYSQVRQNITEDGRVGLSWSPEGAVVLRDEA